MIKDTVQIEKIIHETVVSPKTVTAILCSRNRFDQLQESIEALFQSARHPENIEVIVRIDEDDASTISQIHLLPSTVKVIVGRSLKYTELHIGYWEMTQQATGEFLMIYTDDFFLSPNWDDYIEMHRGQICVIWTKSELTFAVHRSIPLVWERFCMVYHVDNLYKIVALELKAYVRHDEFILTHAHVGEGRVHHYPEDIEIYMWPNFKPLIYEMTDIMKDYIRSELFVDYKPLTSGVNSQSHPINDYARGKIYWWPIEPDAYPMYYYIKGAREWFQPGSYYQDLWEEGTKWVADPIPKSERRAMRLPQSVGIK